MKLLLFAGGKYYPNGGWKDMRGICSDREHCMALLESVGPQIMSEMGYGAMQPKKHDVWYHIVDADSLCIAEDGWYPEQ